MAREAATAAALMGDALAKLSRIRSALAAAKTIDETIDLRDQVAAVVTFAKAARLNLENVNAAMELKLRTERKAGELLAAMSGLGKRGGNRTSSDNVQLDSLGIAKHESHRWQKLASVPEETFSSYVEGFNEARQEMTTAAVMRQWASQRSPDNTATEPARDGLVASLENLNAAIARIYAKWPVDDVPTLAAKLRHFAEELDETGELQL